MEEWAVINMFPQTYTDFHIRPYELMVLFFLGRQRIATPLRLVRLQQVPRNVSVVKLDYHNFLLRNSSGFEAQHLH